MKFSFWYLVGGIALVGVGAYVMRKRIAEGMAKASDMPAPTDAQKQVNRVSLSALLGKSPGAATVAATDATAEQSTSRYPAVTAGANRAVS